MKQLIIPIALIVRSVLCEIEEYFAWLKDQTLKILAVKKLKQRGGRASERV